MNGSIRLWREVVCVMCGLAALVSCHGDGIQPPGNRQDNGRPIEVRTLNDGKKVGVLAVVRDEGPPITVNITYVTDIPLAEHNRLQDEVRRLWSESFSHDAQAAGATKAYIFAQESKPRPGGRVSERATGFVLQRDASGKWVEGGGF
jgi:hypothetical protein